MKATNGLKEIHELRPIRPRMEPSVVYLRFGQWGIRSRNWKTNEAECGVSVFEAKLRDGFVELVLNEDLNAEYVGRFRGRCVFPVTGNLVGIGSAGEPLLRELKLLAYPVLLSSIPTTFRTVTPAPLSAVPTSMRGQSHENAIWKISR